VTSARSWLIAGIVHVVFDASVAGAYAWEHRPGYMAFWSVCAAVWLGCTVVWARRDGAR
jgi:hypothetical protein